jgi:hypothetical protein
MLIAEGFQFFDRGTDIRKAALPGFGKCIPVPIALGGGRFPLRRITILGEFRLSVKPRGNLRECFVMSRVRRSRLRLSVGLDLQGFVVVLALDRFEFSLFGFKDFVHQRLKVRIGSLRVILVASLQVTGGTLIGALSIFTQKADRSAGFRLKDSTRTAEPTNLIFRK